MPKYLLDYATSQAGSFSGQIARATGIPYTINPDVDNVVSISSTVELMSALEQMRTAAGTPLFNRLLPYEAQVTKLPPLPSHYWPMTETSGDGLYNAITYSALGTYGSGVTLGQAGPLADGGVAAGFDGTANSWALNTATALLDNPSVNSFSLECWVRPANTTQFTSLPRLLTNGNLAAGGGGRYEIGLFVNASSQAAVAFNWNNTSVLTLANTNVTLAANTWYHVVVSSTPTSRTVYVNGVASTASTASLTAMGALSTQTGVNVSAGNIKSNAAWVSGAAGAFNGRIGHCAIYGTALTPAQVQLNYMVGKRGTT